MEIIALINKIISIFVLISIIIFKNIIKMKRLTKWLKNLFATKKVKNEKQSSAIPDPSAPPPKGKAR